MPSEPPESNFKDKVRITAYKCVERNGVVWTYMGRQATPPPMSELDWNLVPEGQAFVSKRVQFCNWFQALEGGIDSTHVDFIHSLLPKPRGAEPTDDAPRQDERSPSDEQFAASIDRLARDTQKFRHYETLPTPYGVMIGNQRPNPLNEDEVIWRINHYVLPFYTLFPGTPGSLSGHAWVPIDDERTLAFHWNYNPDRPYTDAEREQRRHPGPDGTDDFHLTEESTAPTTAEAYGAWTPIQRRENDYMIDYDAQRTKRFSGIPGGWNQDAAVQESMGSVASRSREHLGTSDGGIIAARRRFIAISKAWRDHAVPPPSLDDPSAFRVRPGQALLPREADWVTEMKGVVEGGIGKAAGSQYSTGRPPADSSR
jgi:phenylpropionate dioxygenase-like ring-hydroxylating dioxygenase large terminal subunit